jgi:hypothetical protein
MTPVRDASHRSGPKLTVRVSKEPRMRRGLIVTKLLKSLIG